MKRRTKPTIPIRPVKIPESAIIEGMAEAIGISADRVTLELTDTGEICFLLDGQKLIAARQDFTPRKSIYVVPRAPGTEIKNNETPKLQIADELPLGREITS